MDYLKDLFKLEGKVAAITGGGGQLGTAIGLGCAQAGMRVAILDKSPDAAETTAEEIRKKGGQAHAVGVDVTSKKELEAALSSVIGKFGRVDALLCGAGLNAPTPFLEITLEEWNAILNVQLTGTFLACQVFGRQMLEQGGGSIVNISSVSSGPPLSKAFTYSVAKAGVKNLSQNLAREWATRGVRVNILRPGFFPTEWSKKHFITPDREKAILGHTPMGRYGKPAELCGAVLWLFSDAASFVTGAEICVDGGFTCTTI
jgi:NAD(P)-dependent dehydrogenase (short-subunit alcohol dehydrogenase family)